MPRFEEKYGPWALVTGAARGVGAAFAQALAGRGLSLLLVDRDEQGLQTRASELRAAGATAAPLVCDLSCDDFLGPLTEAIGDREVGLLVNNAGICLAGSFVEQPIGELRAAQRVNVDAPLILSHHLARGMLERGHGGIVMISSLSALTGLPSMVHYASTKAYGAALGDGLWNELGPRGVDVVTLLGPSMDTPGFRATGASTRVRFVPTADVAEATLDALGHRSRLTVGFEGQILLEGLSRLLPRDALLRFVGDRIRGMVRTASASESSSA